MQARSADHASRFPAALLVQMPLAPSGVPGSLQRVLAKGEELFAEGDDADFFYQVKSGAIRSCKLLSDGRRQINAFHLPGDIFGLEAGEEHRFSAEAIGATSVVAYRRSRLAALVQEDAGLRDRILTTTLHSLARAQDHMMLLGRKTAPEKIATFLLEMAKRMSADSAHVELPMQRADIADHLGLTIETVSRTLTQFARNGLIELLPAGRSIGLCNRTALQRLNA